VPTSPSSVLAAPHRIQGGTRSTISVASRVYRPWAGGGVVESGAFGVLFLSSHRSGIQKGMGGAIPDYGYRLPCTTTVQQPVAQSSPPYLRGMSGEEIRGHEPCHKNLPRISFTLISTRPIQRMIDPRSLLPWFLCRHGWPEQTSPPHTDSESC
jgi:hypothetical protein